MIEYDFEDALSQKRKEKGEYFLDFSFSAVVFLRKASSLPHIMTVNISFPDGQKIKYKLPTIRVQEYTKDEIFEKNLFFFIPYYIMRYEEQIFEINEEKEKLKELVEDYEDIYIRLSILEKENIIDSDCLYNLVELTEMLIDIVAENAENIKREVKYMGGRVLELKSEKLLKQGRKIGIEENCKLVSILLKEKKYSELERITEDERYRNEMYIKYKISPAEQSDNK